MPDPFFSVVMPVRDPDPGMFRKAFASAYAELARHRLWGEVLLQDNADLWDRIDCLPGLCCSYEKNPADLGLYGSVNAALRRARGEWVHVLHADDWALPGFYPTMFHALDALPETVGAASCHYSNLDDETGWTSSPPPFRDGPGDISDDLRERFTRGNPLQQVAVVFRRGAWEALGGFREDMPYAGDWEFYARLLTEYDWWCVPHDLARYRLHPGAGYNAMLADGRAERDIRECRRLAAEYRGRAALTRGAVST